MFDIHTIKDKLSRKPSQGEDPRIGEARRLNREQLLSLLVSISEERDELRDQVRDLTRQLEEEKKKNQDRLIRIENAGSIAQAALEVNHIFEDAQKAADDYLASLRAAAEESERNRREEDPQNEDEAEPQTEEEAK